MNDPESFPKNSPVLAHMTVHSCGYLADSNWVWFLRKTGFRLQNVSVHLVIGDIYCLLTNNIKIINIKVRLTNVNKDGQVKVNRKSEIFATQKFVQSVLPRVATISDNLSDYLRNRIAGPSTFTYSLLDINPADQ